MTYFIYQICLSPTAPYYQMLALFCGHPFCLSCWGEYLTTRIVSERMVMAITCPAYNCAALIDARTVFNLLPDVNIRLKYQKLVAGDFVLYNDLLRWCPGPDCDWVIRVSNIEPRRVTCRRGHSFCFACASNWHEPVHCWMRDGSKNATKTMQRPSGFWSTQKCYICDSYQIVLLIIVDCTFLFLGMPHL